MNLRKDHYRGLARAGRPAAPLDATRPASRAEGVPAGGSRARRGLPVASRFPHPPGIPSQPPGTARPLRETRKKGSGGPPPRLGAPGRAAAAGPWRRGCGCALGRARAPRSSLLSPPPSPPLSREKRGGSRRRERKGGLSLVLAPGPHARARPPPSRPAPVRRRAAFPSRAGRPEPRLSCRLKRPGY